MSAWWNAAISKPVLVTLQLCLNYLAEVIAYLVARSTSGLQQLSVWPNTSRLSRLQQYMAHLQHRISTTYLGYEQLCCNAANLKWTWRLLPRFRYLSSNPFHITTKLFIWVISYLPKLAPKLRLCEHVVGDLYMVVMIQNHISGALIWAIHLAASGKRKDLSIVLTKFMYDENMVFGNLRLPNILYDVSNYFVVLGLGKRCIEL